MGYFESVAVCLCLEWLGPFVYDDLVCKIVCRFGILCPKIFGYYFHFVGLELFVHCNTFRLVYSHTNTPLSVLLSWTTFSTKLWVDLNLHCYLNGFICFFFSMDVFFSSRSFRVEREREGEKKEIIKVKIFSAV